MRILNKMLLGYAIIAVLAGIVGIVGVNGLKKVNREFREVAGEVLPLNRALEELRFGGMRIISSTMELAFLLDAGSDEAARKGRAAEEREVLESGYRYHDRAMTECRSLMERVPGEVGLLRQMEVAGAELKAASAAFIAAKKGRASQGRMLLAKERFEVAEHGFLLAVQKSRDWEMLELEQSKGKVNKEIAFTMMSILVIAAVTFAMALVSGGLISATISRRVGRLNQGLRCIADGDLGTCLQIETSDELGDLALSFNTMAGQLRSSKEENTATAAFLDRVINSMVDSLVVVAENGLIHSVNHATCSMLGYEENALVGTSFASLFKDAQQCEELLATVVEGGSIREVEVEYLTRDDDAIPVLLSVSVMESHAGRTDFRICIAHNISLRKQAEHEIKYLAYNDQLTNLPNRILFTDRLQQAMVKADREPGTLAVLFFDLDRFKDINDTRGHASGDLLLWLVAHRFESMVRKSDTLARFGGDEFVLLCSGLSGAQDAARIAEKLLELLEVPFNLEGSDIFITASIGIVCYPADGKDAISLLKNADLAMYAAKERGRNTYQFFSVEMNNQVQERNYLEAGLRTALHTDQLFLQYQPQVDIKTGRIYGVEALLRWNHPEHGMISPDRFIPVAEHTGMIRPLGDWVLETACRQVKQWIDAGYPALNIAVNVSGSQFQHPGFMEQVEKTLQKVGLDASLLELEITESVLMADPQGTAQFLARLKELKVQIAIDDFGTGYSSLSYLMDFPIDRLKIDKSFIRNISSGTDMAIIVDAVVALGHSLGLRVLAEGVETITELEYLMRLGCDEAQGYYFARPMPAGDIMQLLARHAQDEIPVLLPCFETVGLPVIDVQPPSC